MEKPELEAYDSIRLKRGVKLALEGIQETVRQMEHKRPALSDVVQRLLELAEEQAVASTAAGAPPSEEALARNYNSENGHQHDLLEVILEGENLSMKEAIEKNLRAFAFTTLVAGRKSEEQIDRDLATMIKSQISQPQRGKGALKKRRTRVA